MLQQTSPFTAGPVCLMEALRRLQPAYKVEADDEFLIWRASNILFLADGHPGCGPYGLALAAQQRGLRAEVHSYLLEEALKSWNGSQSGSVDKCLLVHHHDLQQSLKNGLELHQKSFDLGAMSRYLHSGALIMLLDMSVPAGHWVLLTDVDSPGWQVYDPAVTDHATDTYSHLWSDEEISRRLVEPETSSQTMVILRA